MRSIRIRIYSRPECHLCDDAKSVLDRFAGEYPLMIETVNIDNDPEAQALYRYEIPVVMIEGRKLFKFRIDEQKLRTALDAELRHT